MTEGLWEWLFFRPLPAYAVTLCVLVVWAAVSASDPLPKIAQMVGTLTFGLGCALVFLTALFMLIDRTVGVVRVLLRRAFLAAATAGIATGVFVGAAVRELGREVARKAYDVRVRRARTPVRVALEASGDVGGAPDEKPQPRAKEAQRVGGV